MSNDDMTKKIEKTRADMALMDAYWYLANAMDNEQEIPVDKILLLVQFMLTSYVLLLILINGIFNFRFRNC